MRLAHLSLGDFRSYESLELDFGGEHQLFLGQNGEGKTNLLEAIHILGTGSSMRAARDPALVRHGAPGYRVGGRFLDENAAEKTALRAEVIYESGTNGRSSTSAGTKRILLDRKPGRASDLLGAIKVVAFAPADQELVQGGGSVRRRYLDATGSQLSAEYLQLLREYQRAMRQRNETLTWAYGHEHGRSNAARAREPWTELLVEVGGGLMTRRAALVARIADTAREAARDSFRGKGPIGVEYVPGTPFSSKEDPRAALREALGRSTSRDEAVGYTTVGPHLDDLLLTLGGRELRRFGSLGQQQLAAMFLKLSQAALVRSIAGATPILLVDEMFAILDRRAAEDFLERVESGGQIFLATAQEGWLGELRHRRFHVHHVRSGTVVSE